MSDDISKVVAMLREPPEELIVAAGLYDRPEGWKPNARIRLTAIADYLDQHARTAPGGGRLPEAEAKSINETGRLLSKAFALPEVSEPSRADLIEALAGARSLVEKWCHYQGDTPELFDKYLGPIDSVLSRERRV
jgi:hypothetical protein